MQIEEPKIYPKKKKQKRNYSPEEIERRRQRMIGNQIHKGFKHPNQFRKPNKHKKTVKVRREISKRMMGNSIRKGKSFNPTQETRQKISDALSKKPKNWYKVKTEIPEYLIPHPKIFSEVFR